MRALPDLPVAEALPALRSALAAAGAAVLVAPPGAGKTTLVPLALLAEPWLRGRSIVVLEPRRLAARAAASRMASLLGEPPGATVGWRVRFDAKVSRATRVEVVTEGILARRLQGDPALEGVGLVVFDEVHERHLVTDLTLALALDARRHLRSDLRILAMSATIDAAAVAALLGAAPVVRSEGREHAVDVVFAATDAGPRPHEATAAAVRRALGETEGDVLVFLPGMGEILRTREALAPAATGGPGGAVLHVLHGDVAPDAQEAALRPDAGGRRKVVLSSSIAESSLTIEGIRAVVDAGWTRAPRFDPGTAMTRLETVRVSRATADQRAGRAGREGPGRCWRLWSESTHAALIAAPVPEIRAADLATLALELACWGTTDPADLAWLDPPPAAAFAQARALLADLEAIDAAGRATATGRALASLPVHPRLGHALWRAAPFGLAAVACDVAALIGERDVLRPGAARSADLALRVEALRAFRAQGASGAAALGADPGACARAVRAARDMHERLAYARAQRDAPPDLSPTGRELDAAVGRVLALAYPDRIGRLRDAPGRWLLSGGRGARLRDAGDPIAAERFVVAAALDLGEGEAIVQHAAPLREEDLRAAPLAGLVRTTDAVRWDARAEGVEGTREERLGAIVLSSRPLPEPLDPALLRAALLEGVRALGLAALPWTPATESLRARAGSMRVWFPDEAWPDLSDGALLGTLDAWLGPALEAASVRRRAHLARIDLHAALGALLGHRLRVRIDEGAPTHVGVPSGARRPLAYEPGQAPVLAVKLQEMFGLADGPRVAFGRVPVTLQLLSPAGRPIQVTQDLRSFWQRTYPEVRKELRGRYPRHPWPEDPWSAVPTARAKRARKR